MKIVVDQNIRGAESTFGQHGELSFLEGRAIRNRDLRDAEALIVRTATPVDEALLMNTTDGKDVIMCNTVTPRTASGKIELYSVELDEKFGFGVPRYDPAEKDHPFTVISPSSQKRTNATFGSDQASEGVEVVEIHPDDARRHVIEDGSLVKLENDIGSVILKAKISAAVRRGVLYTPKGTWLHTSETGRTVNALISADLRTDIVDGACYNETFVDIEVV